MKISVYSIKDTKTAFMTPTFYHNDEVAIRDLKFALNDGFSSSNFICRNYPDLELWKIGTFDDVTGSLDADCHFVVRLADLKEGVCNA